MIDSDHPQFFTLVADVHAFYRQNFSDFAGKVWLAAMRPFDFAVIAEAFNRHAVDPERGQFMPKPADIVRLLSGAGMDGRPGPEEAWALVPKDESDTAVWSEEMAGAYAVASPLLEAGDAIGARMAFKETYDRLVREAREQRKPAAWTISLGWDTDKRTTAIRNAISAGRYLESKAQHLLPPPSDVGPIGALLEGRQLALPHDLPESDKEFARRKFAELRQQIENTPSRWERHCAERDKARAAENQARAQQLAKVNERIPGEEG